MEKMFKHRSTKSELLDQENLAKDDLFRNLYELEVINRKLGGHRATLKGVQELIKADKNKTYRLIDFACGGGDTLRFLAEWGEKNRINFKLKGIDLLPDAIEYAKNQSEGYDIDWEVKDFRKVSEEKHEISICSLVCHHFYGQELIDFVYKMLETADLGVVINDLHRHPLAYYGIAFLSQLFSQSYLVKHDSKLSVLKGFKKSEWVNFFEENKISHYQIQWVWAFRHLILLKK